MKPTPAWAVAVVTLLAGCHGSGAAPAAMPALAGRAIGDSAMYGVRILTLDPVQEKATVRIVKPGNLIVLAVMPGRDIELIHPGTPGMPGMPTSQKNGVTTIGVQRFESGPRTANADAAAAAQARLQYERCEAARRAAERQAAVATKAVRRDSTGKVIFEPGTGAAPVDTRDRQAPCDRLAAETNSRSGPRKLPPREPGERYLVVLTSPWPLSVAQLNERLATLTTIAPDVATTIEAIAAGIYAGLPGTWGGYYVAW